MWSIMSSNSDTMYIAWSNFPNAVYSEACASSARSKPAFLYKRRILRYPKPIRATWPHGWERWQKTKMRCRRLRFTSSASLLQIETNKRMQYMQQSTKLFESNKLSKMKWLPSLQWHLEHLKRIKRIHLQFENGQLIVVNHLHHLEHNVQTMNIEQWRIGIEAFCMSWTMAI